MLTISSQSTSPACGTWAFVSNNGETYLNLGCYATSFLSFVVQRSPSTTSSITSSTSSTISSTSSAISSTSSTFSSTSSAILPTATPTHSSGVNVAGAVGGTIGGLASLIGAVAAVWALLRKRKKNAPEVHIGSIDKGTRHVAQTNSPNLTGEEGHAGATNVNLVFH